MIYQRPQLSDDELIRLAMFEMELFRQPRRIQIAVISAVLVENVSLTREVNEHRQARGFDPLPTYDPKLEVSHESA